MKSFSIEADVSDEVRLESFASQLASVLTAPLVIYLEGLLGAGKTTFVRALLKSMGYVGRVKSPTYGLLEHYGVGEMSLLHLDLYRIEDVGELEYLALRDLCTPQTVLLIEWPSRARGAIPEADIVVRFSDSMTDRVLVAASATARGQGVLSGIAVDAPY
jgi:tRNA threonylcarbamoyladenosine biosynthesis protein TsaE